MLFRSFQTKNKNLELSVTFQVKNMGLTMHIVNALNIAMKSHDFVIVLEDDVLFNRESVNALIEGIHNYGENSDFGAISMFSPIYQNRKSKFLLRKNFWRKTSYFGCWGWATNRKTWLQYSLKISDELTSKLHASVRFNKLSKTSQNVWNGRFGKVILNPTKTWDFQFQHLLFRENLNVYAPVLTLSGNNGFGDGIATNTKSDRPRWVSKDVPNLIRPKKIIKSPLMNFLLVQIDKFTFAFDNRTSQIYLHWKSILKN